MKQKSKHTFTFRIRDFLVRRQSKIHGCVSLTNGTGSSPRIILFSSVTFKMSTTSFLLIRYLMKIQLHHSSQTKSPKEVTKEYKSRFLLLFYLMLKGSGSLPLTNGFGSGTLLSMGLIIHFKQYQYYGIIHRYL
jgi:hypothetical protein